MRFTACNGRTELFERGGLQNGALLAAQDEKQSVPDESAPGCHDAGHNPEGRLTLKQTEKGNRYNNNLQQNNDKLFKRTKFCHSKTG